MKIRPNYFLDPIMKEVSNKLGIPFTKVQECVACQYEFTRKNIENYDPRTQTGSRVIYLINFGKFLISDKIIQVLKDKYKKEEVEDEAI